MSWFRPAYLPVPRLRRAPVRVAALRRCVCHLSERYFHIDTATADRRDSGGRIVCPTFNRREGACALAVASRGVTRGLLRCLRSPIRQRQPARTLAQHEMPASFPKNGHPAFASQWDAVHRASSHVLPGLSVLCCYKEDAIEASRRRQGKTNTRGDLLAYGKRRQSAHARARLSSMRSPVPSIDDAGVSPLWG